MFNRKSFKPNSNSGLSLPELMHFKINVKIPHSPILLLKYKAVVPKAIYFKFHPFLSKNCIHDEVWGVPKSYQINLRNSYFKNTKASKNTLHLKFPR